MADKKQMPLIPEKPPVYRCQIICLDGPAKMLELDCEPWPEAGMFKLMVRQGPRVVSVWIPISRIDTVEFWEEEVEA